MTTRIWFSILSALPILCVAQEHAAFRDSVSAYFQSMRKAPDSLRLQAAENLESLFEAFYVEPAHFDHELDSVPFLGQLTSNDGLLKILCWNIVLKDGTFRYYCVMRHRADKKTVAITVFRDGSNTWDRIGYRTLRPDEWYGALYYRILSNRFRGKTYYTLLGWDGNDQLTNRKVVDVLMFQGKSVLLGSPVFTASDGRPAHRLIFEYANDVSMALNYDKKTKRIVMDHLAPEDSRFTGQFQFYAPDFSYDALEFKKGKWLLQKDVFATNQGLNNLSETARPGDFKD